MAGTMAGPEVIPLTVFNLGSFESFVDIMSVVTFIYWALDLPGVKDQHGSVLEGSVDTRVLEVTPHVPWQMDCHTSFVCLSGTFLVGVDVDGTLDMRPGPIAKKQNHYIACAWFAVSDNMNGTDTWVYVFGLKHAAPWKQRFRGCHQDVASQYLVSFHWALTQFAPATNNVAPQNAVERAFASLIVIYAFVAFSSFVSAMTNATNELRAFTLLLKSARQEAQIRKFLDDKTLAAVGTISSCDSPGPRVTRRSSGYRGGEKKLRSKELPKIPQSDEQREMYKATKLQDPWRAWRGTPSCPEVDQSWQPVMRIILNCLCKSLRYREAAEVFERFPSRDTMAYNMYLNMLARLQHTYQFDKTLQQMEEETVPQSWVTMCAIMTMCKSTNDWQQAAPFALQLLDGLKSDTSGEGSIEVPYLIAMTACARARAKDQVAELLEEGKRNPDFKVKGASAFGGLHYNALIMACGTDTAAARAAFEKLKADRMEPTGCAAGWWPDSVWLMEQRDIYLEMRKLCPREPVEESLAILLKSAVAEDSESSVNWAPWWWMEAAPVGEAVEAPLPAGWESATDPSTGNRYYWQLSNPTGTTTWERPR
eukprot:Skav229717  [mRNA]  locus=scaffold49:261492:275306:- [translate_table: standard]